LRIVGEEIDRFAETDIGRIAERYEGRAAEMMGTGPVGDGGYQGAGLGYEREPALWR
jgi:hypothetical protein